MEEVTIIGIDLAKNVFQLHGSAADGSVIFRKKLTRQQFQRFMTAQPPCTVAMEACPGSHYWAREMAKLGHTVKVISPQYVKPYVKRRKNDAADAEAIAEAATRPHMRFVEPKSAEQQARAVVFRVRQKAIAQRIELINALRSHLYEFGFIAPVGLQHLAKLAAVLEDETSDLPTAARNACRGVLRQIEGLGVEIAALGSEPSGDITEISDLMGGERSTSGPSPPPAAQNLIFKNICLRGRAGNPLPYNQHQRKCRRASRRAGAIQRAA